MREEELRDTKKEGGREDEAAQSHLSHSNLDSAIPRALSPSLFILLLTLLLTHLLFILVHSLVHSLVNSLGHTLVHTVYAFTMQSPSAFPRASGRVLVAMNLLPTELYADPSASSLSLHVRKRRGNSALYSAQSYLESSDWDTVLVAWTGEIADLDDPDSALTDFRLDPETEAHAAQMLSDQAATSGSTVAPVFLYGGAQSRWRAYAEQGTCSHFIYTYTFTYTYTSILTG